MKKLIVSFLLLTACSSGPGLTPIEQDGLVVIDSPHQAKVLFTMDSPGPPPELLLKIFDEYSQTPLFLHVVWRINTPPTSTHLAQFPGRKIKQFWDREGKTSSTNGKLLVQGKPVELERLALRMALAHAAAWND